MADIAATMRSVRRRSAFSRRNVSSSSRSSLVSASAMPIPFASRPRRVSWCRGVNLRRGCDSDAGRGQGWRCVAVPAERPLRYFQMTRTHPAGAEISSGSSSSLTMLVPGPPLTTTDHGRGNAAWMPAAEPRYCVAEVTEEARDGWRDFADRVGVDRTALAEVIGLALGAMDGRLPPVVAGWVDEALALKNERRRRG